MDTIPLWNRIKYRIKCETKHLNNVIRFPEENVQIATLLRPLTESPKLWPMTTYNPLNRLKDLAIICIPHTHKYYIPKYMTYHCIKYPRVHVFSVRVYPHRQFSVQWQLLWNFNNVMVEWIYKSFISKRTNLSPQLMKTMLNGWTEPSLFLLF